MAETGVTHESGADKGRFVLGEAELTYRRAGEGRIVADHTFVPPTMRGGGVAGKLVEALIATARSEGWTIVPACSYVAAAFERHPEWADLRAG